MGSHGKSTVKKIISCDKFILTDSNHGNTTSEIEDVRKLLLQEPEIQSSLKSHIGVSAHAQLGGCSLTTDL